MVFLLGPKIVLNTAVVDLASRDLDLNSIIYPTKDVVDQTNFLYPKLFSVNSDVIANGITRAAYKK